MLNPVIVPAAISPSSMTDQCPTCDGVGFLRRDVPPGHPDFGQPLPCPCGLVARRRSVRLDGLLGFTDELKLKSFADLGPVAKQGLARLAARDYAANPRGWLYLYGPPGDGKTTLIAAAVNELRAAGRVAVFATVPDLLTFLRSTFNDGAGASFDSTWRHLLSVDILALDDLGAENPTDWTRERIFELVNARYRARLCTLVASNLEPERQESRIASRFRDVDLCRCEFAGPDDLRRRQR